MNIATIILFLAWGLIALFLGTKHGLNTAGKILKKESEVLIKAKEEAELGVLKLKTASDEMKKNSLTLNVLLNLADEKVAEIQKEKSTAAPINKELLK